ncbi:hypothetical protein WJX84_006474 [Apatococcus fuscideae]|uniref:RWD domain-containing protein n=1 Tax=Apatococcus fuscideae TaxID=2026836 RepID=A0AAW1T291_9CHLO
MPSRTARPHITLKIQLPEDYPENSAPDLEILAAHLPQQTRSWLIDQLQARFSPGCGPVIYDWLEWLRGEGLLDDLLPGQGETPAGTKEPHAEAAAASTAAEEAASSAQEYLSHLDEVGSHILHGEPITEKRSTFQAHLARVDTAKGVQEVMEALLKNNKIQNATHNIMAFRIQLPNSDTFLQDCDDDGESAAGSRLLHLLQIMDEANIDMLAATSRRNTESAL